MVATFAHFTLSLRALRSCKQYIFLNTVKAPKILHASVFDLYNLK